MNESNNIYLLNLLLNLIERISRDIFANHLFPPAPVAARVTLTWQVSPALLPLLLYMMNLIMKEVFLL